VGAVLWYFDLALSAFSEEPLLGQDITDVVRLQVDIGDSKERVLQFFELNRFESDSVHGDEGYQGCLKGVLRGHFFSSPFERVVIVYVCLENDVVVGVNGRIHSVAL